jgi:hypothetical protein
MLIRSLMAACALFCVTQNAAAATITYDFSTSSSAYSLTKCFPGPCASDLQVKAKTVSNDTQTVTSVAGTGVGIGQWAGNGLGLLNSGTDNSHTVDGRGLNDLLELTFSSAVRIVSASFTYAGVLSNSNDAFDFYADDDNDGSIAGDRLFAHQDIFAVSGNGTHTFVGGSPYSTTFGFAASWENTVKVCTRWYYGRCKSWSEKTYFDSFKLKSVTVELRPDNPPEVPVPAALPLLASALGLGAFLARRQRRNG